jgi:2-oxoisovalerate dehydrogenase E1 component
MIESTVDNSSKDTAIEEIKINVLRDYRLAVESREASLIGRREVLTGKAKFGIFGDGKELPQLAWAKVFKAGDFRSGYYRDQTFMMAIGALTTQEFFASLYADTDHELEPASAGRQMNGHFATQSLDASGNWKNLMAQVNSSADISPTAGQMPRLLGLAEASKHYRDNKGLKGFTQFSNKGNEVAWGSIGNASTSEGPFFETINAAGVLQVPMVISIWDDDYGISVHSKYQTTKENISEILKGFQRNNEEDGYEILHVKGWDYAALIETYEKADRIARKKHIPVMVHVTELTQPQGHSTSGSHERYKNEQRLKWEREFDCNKKMREWIIGNSLATEDELKELEKEAQKEARQAKSAAWKNFISAIKEDISEVLVLLREANAIADDPTIVAKLIKELENNLEPLRRDGISALRKTLRQVRKDTSGVKIKITAWLEKNLALSHDRYGSHLYSESELSPLKISEVAPDYSVDSKEVDARIILRENFDRLLEERPEILIFGEDSGKIGDVNQGLEGLQEKHGENRVADTGIREATILGQGIGMAMRGLRPIAEIQYLDYLLYALQVMSDDLASLHYRSKGRQKAPVIVRTRGHRLEGVWHSGSPMGMIINAVRGVHVLVPRNMTQAAGFYNTVLDGDDPALIVECLNGYRLKEKMPDNLAAIRTPLGFPETIRSGNDMTVVSYGSTLRVVMEAAEELAKFSIDLEVIDPQSLLPFDVNHLIVESVKTTNRLLVVDEDVPGGASAFILQQIIEEQNGYQYLDSAAQTLTATANRPAYGSDGDYFSKPSAEDIFEKVYAMMHEFNPEQYPALY